MIRTLIPAAALVVACSQANPALVALSAEGVVRAERLPVSLDELSSFLDRCREAAPRSREVRLHVDVDATWGHVQWLFTVFMEEGFRHVRLVPSHGASLRLTLPENVVICYVEPPRPSFVVTVDVEDGHYRCGEDTTRDPDGIGRWVAEAVRRAERWTPVGEVRAAPGATLGEVLPALHALQSLEEVAFVEAWIPSRDARRVRRLPPLKCQSRPAGLGMRFTTYMNGYVPED